MKTFILSIISAFIINASAIAANPTSETKGFNEKEFVQHRTEQMTNRYGLSKKQAKQVNEINEKLAQIIADNSPAASTSTNKRTLRNRQAGMLQKANVAYDLALQKILNFQQYQDYLADKAAKQPKHNASLLSQHKAPHAPHFMAMRHE